MPLNLDLSESETKLARARIHLESLKHEAAAIINDPGLHVLRLGEIDKQTGWASLFLTTKNIPKHRLGPIAGDFVHNLRSALDYIITALVSASGAEICRSHQFPLFSDEGSYVERNGAAAPGKGNLKGIIYGLEEIRDSQPFNYKPLPKDDPLVGLNTLSNTDKHRELAVSISNVESITAEFDPEFVEGVIIERPHITFTDQEYEIYRARFPGPPFPSDVTFKGEVAARICFLVRVLGDKTKGQVVYLDSLEPMFVYVAAIVETFKAL